MLVEAAYNGDTLGLSSRFILLISLLLISCASAQAQVRIVQWTDVHSSVETLTRQVLAIDRVGQDFLNKNPKGEFIIHVIGDFTSINPYNVEDGGKDTLEALRILRERGYTVLFTVGNHDAFDWSGKINGAKLFVEQMQILKSWGVEILITNLREKSAALRELTSRSYPLRTLDRSTHIVGLTLPILMTKSNLNEATASSIFQGIETYKQSFKRIIPNLSGLGVEAVIFAVHEGHSKLAKQVPLIQSAIEGLNKPLSVPLIMGAHDHLTASYRKSGIHFSNAASHGSFSVIDFNRQGEIQSERLMHIAMNEGRLADVDPELFRIGDVRVNDLSQADVLAEPWLKGFHVRLEARLDLIRLRLGKVLTTLEHGIPQHKQHLKKGQQILGSVLSESLAEWARHTLGPLTKGVPIVAMTNSSAYRLEEALKAGDITTLTIRQMYPFLTEAGMLQLTGEQIEKLYFSLRRFYAVSDKVLHSPQLNFQVREEGGRLWTQNEKGKWQPLKSKRFYWLVMDGWLADHFFGQSYRIPEWLGIIQKRQPYATRSFQGVLESYLPELLRRYERLFLGRPNILLDPVKRHRSCRVIFAA